MAHTVNSIDPILGDNGLIEGMLLRVELLRWIPDLAATATVGGGEEVISTSG